nr:plexin-D1 [Columba livia]
MPAAELTTAVPVCVQFENKSCTSHNITFKYEKNPIISDINPKKSQISGGRIITLEGRGFGLVQNVSMVVRGIGREQTSCKVHTDAMITCPSPAASNTTVGSKPAPVDFYLNGRRYTDARLAPDEELYPEEALHLSKFSMEYYADPQFSTAKKEKWIKHHPGEPLTLVIHKEPDSLGLESTEYQVKIGLISCEIQIVSDKVIHCSVNESLSTSERQLPVTIQVGKFNYTIAMLHLGGGETAIIVSIVICSILLVLSVVALFVFCTKSRRAERYWQKTLLQMEEMESQIREEIRKEGCVKATLISGIKQQINKGSIDAITGKARYTLNEEWLLRENIEAKPRNLNVSFQGCGMDSLSVRAMDTDTLSQVKEKILEAFCKNVPYSQWPRVEDVDLEWFATSTDSYILRDLDDTSVVEDGRKKLNTLAHYKIPEGASLAMSLSDKKDSTLSRVKDLDSEKYFHLVLPTDESVEHKKSHRQSHRKKVLPEIYLTRLLSTKGTLQKFLDDLFKAILSIRDDKPPVAVKYFFDFLEEQAEKRGITDPDTMHIWKTNSLPLRFWVNILKNPQFVFDIDKTDHIDACLSVIAQAFIDACSLSDLQLGKDSPTNKLLYAKEIPEYRKIVQRYYKQIHDMPPLSEQEMNAHLAEESRKYRNEFNTNVAMAEIYKYAKRYRSQIVAALDANPTTKRTQLQHKFEQVIALMEDNIYECCSEA